MTNTQGRTVTVPTDFLPAGKYEVTIYNDDPTMDSRQKVRARTQIVKRASNRKPGKPLTLYLHPSGGAALHFKKLP